MCRNSMEETGWVAANFKTILKLRKIQFNSVALLK